MAIECAPEYLAAEGAMSIAASNVGMASAQELGCIAAGSLVLTFTVSQTFNITTEHVSSLAWNKVDSLYLSDEFLKSQAYAVIYAMMSARVLGLTDVLPETPSTQLTDEEIAEKLDELKIEIANVLVNTTNKIRDTVVMISIGYNRATGRYGIGIKVSKTKFISELENLMQQWADCMIGDTWYESSEYGFNQGCDYIFRDEAGNVVFQDAFYPCAEDFCVMTLGGLDHEEYLINGDIVMGQSFRISQGMANPKPICRKCECRYARSSFLPGTIFESGDMILRGEY